MGDYRPNQYRRRPGRKEPKKKKGPVARAFLLGVVLLLLFIVGATAYVVLDTYDFDIKAAFTDLFDGKEETPEDVPPDEAPPKGEATFLTAITANREEKAFAFVLIRADLGQMTFRACALPPQTLVRGVAKEETIERMLFRSGMAAVCNALEESYGIPIDRYARATQGEFEKIVDQLGGVAFYVEKDLVYNTDELSMHVQGGNQTLTGSAALHVMRYPEWEQGELYQYQTQARVIAALIDNHINEKNMEKGDALFNTLINLVQSDISIADYRASVQEIEKYAALPDKNPTQIISAQGEFTETEDGKKGFRITGNFASALLS